MESVLNNDGGAALAVRPAVMNDIPRILQLVDHSRSIMRANGMTSPQVTRKQKLRIPPAGVDIAEEVPVAPVEDIAEAEEQEEDKPKNIFETIGEAISRSNSLTNEQ